MSLDPEMRALLEVVGHDQMDFLAAHPVEEAVALMRGTPKPAAASLVRWEERWLDTEAGRVRVHVYWPQGEGAHPVLVNFHGGGWVTGSVEGDDLRCQRLALGADCIVVSVDYRLAPEHPFPAPLEDCWAVCAWLHEHAGELGGDSSRLAVSGASAGGNLAAAISWIAREEGLAWPMAQVLFYPVTDATSREEGPPGGPYYLTREAMDWYWDRYAGEADSADPRLSPLLSENFNGLPQTLVMAAELDPLAQEARAYAQALSNAGCKASFTEFPGVIHGFASLAPDHHSTLEATDLAVRFLKEAFAA